MTMKSVSVILLLSCAGLIAANAVSRPKNLKAGEVLVDCYPDAGSTQDGCTARGCVWQENTDPSINPPWCLVPEGYGYEVVGDAVDTSLGFNLNLARKAGQTSFYGGDIDNIRLSVEYWSENIVRIKFDDPNNARYEVPIPLAYTPSSKPASTDYEVTYVNDPQFGVVVTRKSTGTVIFNTNQPGFVFADQFLQTTTTPPSSTIYGFGEQRHGVYDHDMNWRTWVAFNHDNPPTNNDNLYGTQPFYLNVEDAAGNANGVFLYNSNAQEYVLQPAPAITFRTIGGVLDFYIYLGPTPEDVVKQHYSLIGLPLMPSYWFLGFQLCRYGYKSTNEVRSVANGMRNNQIPYDVQICDIDAYDGWKDFTYNPNGFSDMPAFVDELHRNGTRYIPIVDAAIGSDPSNIGNYPPLDDGLAADIFIKQANGDILEGQVWPGNAYFPDFTNPGANDYWSTQHLKFYNDLGVHYDGIWIDMNDPSNFVDGSLTGCPDNNINHPPYPTHAQGTPDALYHKTLCLDAQQSLGSHYDVHNLYGHYEAQSTYVALQSVFPGKRPNLFSRSTYATSGRYTAHWLGDNESTFSSMRDSIPGMLEFNLFGTPVVGADICGFNGNTWEELCIRWQQLGAFYPYSRNHNSGSVAQDPPSLGQNVIDATKAALNERYRLLPYLYTLLHDSHTVGGTTARPLVHEFPADPNTYGIDFQFLWGPALYISPVVDEGAENVNIYFPDARWYNYYTGAQVTSVGTTIVVDSPLIGGNIPLHVRGGYVLPTQDPSTTTDLSRQNPFGLLVALDESGAASGKQFWDDGETLDTDSSGAFNLLTFSAAAGTLNIQATSTGGGDMGAPLNTIKIYGVASAPTAVTADGAPVDAASINYDSANKALTLSDLNLSLPTDHTVTFN